MEIEAKDTCPECKIELIYEPRLEDEETKDYSDAYWICPNCGKIIPDDTGNCDLLESIVDEWRIKLKRRLMHSRNDTEGLFKIVLEQLNLQRDIYTAFLTVLPDQNYQIDGLKINIKELRIAHISRIFIEKNKIHVDFSAITNLKRRPTRPIIHHFHYVQEEEEKFLDKEGYNIALFISKEWTKEHRKKWNKFHNEMDSHIDYRG